MPFDFTPETPPLEPWQQLLLGAAQRVRRGWCQHVLSDGSGGVCLMGALFEMAGFSEELSLASRAMNRYIGGKGAIPFNNAPGRTAEEVAQAMESAAMEKAHV